MADSKENDKFDLGFKGLIFMIDAPPLVCKVEGSSQYSRRVASKLTWW